MFLGYLWSEKELHKYLGQAVLGERRCTGLGRETCSVFLKSNSRILMKVRRCIQPGMEVYACLQVQQSGRSICPFEASLGYISSVRPTWDIYRDTVLKQHNKPAISHISP